MIVAPRRNSYTVDLRVRDGAARGSGGAATVARIGCTRGCASASSALRASALLDLARAEDAVEAARRSLALAPNEEWGHRLLGAGLVQQGRLQEALDALQEAVRAEPDSVLAHLGLAQLFYHRARTGRRPWRSKPP
jgi:tetratricopeptide (TPR) repeat protein